MSNNELFKLSNSQVYSKDFTLEQGVKTDSSPNFNIGVSKVVGLVLKTSVGVGAGSARIGKIVSANPDAVGAQTVNISIVSTVVTDLSTYTLYWVNESVPNSLI